METDPLTRLRRLLGEQWSPQWRASEAITKACEEIERLRLARPEEQEISREKYITALKLAANRMGVDVTRLHSEAMRILLAAEQLPQN